MQEDAQKFIDVRGYRASGKSYLIALLDGHPDIAAQPAGFADCILGEVITYFHTSAWRQRYKFPWDWYRYEVMRFLYRSNFKATEMSLRGTMLLPVDAGNCAVLPIDYDFFSAEREMFKDMRAMNTQEITPQNVAKMLLTRFLGAAAGAIGEKGIHPKFYLGCGIGGDSNEPFKCDCFQRFFPGSKLIYVHRDPIASIITDFVGHMQDISRSIDMTEDLELLCDMIETWLNTGMRDISLSFEFLHLYLVNTQPETFKVVDFDDMLGNTDTCMRKIVDWLGVPYHSILRTPTGLGREFIPPKGKMNDKSMSTVFAEKMRDQTRIADIITKRLRDVIFPLAQRTIVERDYLMNLYKSVTSDLDGNQEGIVIYGAGEMGTILARMLLYDDIKVEYILDMFKPEFSILPGMPFFTRLPDSHKIDPKHKESMPVYVSLSDRSQYHSLARDLAAMGWRNLIFPREQTPADTSALMQYWNKIQ